MELLDIVEDQGNPTGKTVNRETAHKEGILHRTSHVWIVRRNHNDGKAEILLQKRSRNKDSYPGCYDISSAGHIPAGVDFIPSAIRELKEELGVEAEAKDLHFCGQRRFHFEDVFHGNRFVDNQISNVYLMWLNREEAEFKLQKEEVESVRWFSFEDVYRAVKENTIPHCIYVEELDMVKKKMEDMGVTKKKWWKEAVVYQIYPRSFKDSNGDGIGDLKGITEKIDYLKELGINVIWLSPCYKSPNDDNGYDISDYRDIMDEFGTLEDFKQLLQKAHEREIKILMDLVVNHTSDEHPWFLESRKSKDNPYRDYYIWRDGKGGKEPNNWKSIFSGNAWEYDEKTGQYYLHLFTKKQPDLNWENEKVREEVRDIMKYWLDMGCDGFRLDACTFYSKIPGLPDGKEEEGRIVGMEHYQDGPRMHEFMQEMNREVLSKYDCMTVGETSDVSLENAVQYASLDGRELDMVFQFDQNYLDYGEDDWTHKKVYLPDLKKCFSKWQLGLSGKAWNSLYWTNHDQPRTVSRRGNDSEFRKESQKMLYTMLFTQQGTPYIYQGEEIGMTNISLDSIEDYEDVELKNLWQERVIKGGEDPETLMEGIRYRTRDNARTPMQWDATENAGFSTGKPWFYVNSNYKTINVEESLQDPDSIFHYMQKLIQVRRQNEVLVYGDFREYEPENESLYLYERNFEGKKAFVILNFTENSVSFETPENLKEKKGTCILCNYDNKSFENRTIRPYEACVYLLD